MTEQVRVMIQGTEWAFWEECSVNYGAKQAARSASLTSVDPRTTDGFRGGDIDVGMDAEVYAGGSLLVKGYIETVGPEFSAESHSLRINIVSKSKETLEASATHPTGEIRNKRHLDIVREVDPTGTEWRGTVGENIAVVRVNPGETVFDLAERLARGQGTMLVGTADGAVEAIKDIRGRHAGAIVGSDPDRCPLAGSANITMAGRPSKVHVRGQSHDRHTKGSITAEVTVTDPMIKRVRPRIILHEGDATVEQMRTRGAYHLQRAAGASRTAQIQMPRWRDEGGRIWEPAFLLYCNLPDVRIVGDMVITTVTLSQGKGGTVASLSLADPKSVGAKASKVGKHSGDNNSGSTGKEYDMADTDQLKQSADVQVA